VWALRRRVKRVDLRFYPVIMLPERALDVGGQVGGVFDAQLLTTECSHSMGRS